MGRLLKWLASAALIGVLGWSGWWYLGAEGQKAGIEAWLDAQRQRGWEAEIEKLDVAGYPLDFHLQAEGIEITDRRAGWRWIAPRLRAASRSYSPTRIEVTWPTRQQVGGRGDLVEVTAERMVTLLDLRPGPSMELREASSDVAALRLDAQSGWQAGAEALSVLLAEKAAGDAPPNSYDLKIAADRVLLPEQVVARIDPTGFLEPRIDRVTVLANAAFDQPLGRGTLERGDTALSRATIREAGFVWGEMRLTVSGAFEVDANGYPVGEIRIEAREWRQMLRLAVRAGVIGRGMADDIARGIELFTAMTGGGDVLSAPFGLSGGKIRLLAFPIADAPRFPVPRAE